MKESKTVTMKTESGTVLVTGSSGTIGHALMRRFAGRFENLVGFDRHAPEPPPRVTRIAANRAGSSAANGTEPNIGSASGTPSSSTSVRLAAFPPSARSVAPCAEGLAERLSERRNCWKPAASASTSSMRPDGARVISSRVMTWTS